jgi:uncharacterized protein
VTFFAAEDPGSLSIQVPIHAIGAGGRAVSFSADEVARKALADRFELQGVGDLKVEGKIWPENNAEFLFRGTLTAKVVQTCVVTLEPVENKIDEDILLRLVPAERFDEKALEEAIDPDEEEDLEPYEDDVIDLGPAVTEYLGISLDPYPRKPDAVAPETPVARVVGEEEFKPERENPFAVLKNLRSGG